MNPDQPGSVGTGLLLAASIAVGAWAVTTGLAVWPPTAGLPVSMMLIAIVAGLVLSGRAARRPEWTPGLDLARGIVLKTAVALIGLRLALGDLGELGMLAVPLVCAVIAAGLIASWLAGRLFGLPSRLTALIAVGSAICGASAIAATAPAVRAGAEQAAYAIAFVAVFGLAATLVYPLLLQGMFDDPVLAGLVIGAAIHDTAQVTAAASLFEQSFQAEGVVAAASVTKLARNALMLAVIPLVVWLVSRHQPVDAGSRLPLPLFILAFLALSVLRSLGDWLFGADAGWWQGLLEVAAQLSLFGFAMAMAALAMGIRWGQLAAMGWRPALVAALSSLTVLATAVLWVTAIST